MMSDTKIINFQTKNIVPRKQTISRIRSAFREFQLLNGTSEGSDVVISSFGGIGIFLSVPEDLPNLGKYDLEIFAFGQQVLHILWSPTNGDDFQIIAFRHGDWEDLVISLPEMLK